jgi:hypothetical protein
LLAVAVVVHRKADQQEVAVQVACLLVQQER